MAKTVLEHALEALQEHALAHPKKKKVVDKTRRILEEERLLALSESLYQVQGSGDDIYTLELGPSRVRAEGPYEVKSCSCRAKEFSLREACSHWLAVKFYTLGIKKRSEELKREVHEHLCALEVAKEGLEDLSGLI